MKNKKFAYLFFHLNLFFSSLPENKRKEVIKKCYWPLLNLIDKSDFNIGIEITGWTLKEINKLDQKWIIFFKKFASKIFYKVYNYFTENTFDSSIANFSIISKKVLKAHSRLREQNRSYYLFLNWLGF